MSNPNTNRLPLAGQEIALGPPLAAPTPPVKPKKPHEHYHHDGGLRETVETIVFVVVLVLLLKTFLAEAFVIPTGSMATTLLGYHMQVTCNRCGHRYAVNASSEADPQESGPDPVMGAWCENCQAYNTIRQEEDFQR